MSKIGVALCGLLLVFAAVSFAQQPNEPYGMTDPYSGPTPSGMRFGEMGRVVSVQTGDVEEGYGGMPGCPGCHFGVQPPPCDPDWSGPCIDWKLVGWYSNFRDKHRWSYLDCNRGHGGCGRCRACCLNSCDSCDSCSQ